MREDGPGPGRPRRIYTVGELNHAIQAALEQAFPGTVWVRGEVQRLPADAARRKHVYFELHDASRGEAAGFQIPVALLDWDRQRFGLGRYLDGTDPDFQIRNKLEVCLECRVDFYPPFGKLSLKVVGLDKSFTLGQLEARRRQVLAYLEREGLKELNARLPWPDLPLRVGLVTAAGSAAERDFRTGLAASGHPFTVDLVDCRMQGEQTEPQVVAALAALARRGVDVIVITRGGGSRGDLSWFDQQGIAVAIARSPRPVVTAIGHEIDRSIADVVAKQSCKTPTAAAEFLVALVDAAAARVEEAASRLAERVREVLDGVSRALERLSLRLERRVAGKVAAERERLARDRVRLLGAALARLAAARRDRAHQAQRLVRASGLALRDAGRRLERCGPRLEPGRLLSAWPRRARELDRLDGRLARLVAATVQRAGRRLDHLDEKRRMLDPGRLLARGYTLTTDARGRLLRSAGDTAAGRTLRTRFVDGVVESMVTGAPAAGRAGGGGRGGREEEDTRQQDLFR